MRTLKIIIYIFFIFLLSCKYNRKQKALSGEDTTKIFQSVFDSKLFVRENRRSNADSIFLLKNKYYNKAWPGKSKYFNILFLSDISRSKMLNFGPGSPYDARIRISILKLEQRKDSVSLLMLNHGPNIFYEYQLVKKGEIWKIIKEYAAVGGRRELYEFENEQWYLDLKKKIKQSNDLDSFRPIKLD
ncbi:hypothetical protein [Pedobacter sp. KLB.chiD]|uniref:hypothetical protein n=1 Tax=Pedobacter sp. KLB.chiD TaxID=3387402 RepID=UPI00399A45B8